MHGGPRTSSTSTTATARTPTIDHGHEPIGEVYVVGVHPSERGTGLGTALILVGLHHLRIVGLLEAMLYVDADNTAAIAAYRAAGVHPLGQRRPVPSPARTSG